MVDERCENMATVRMFWPGKEPDLVCVEHAHQSEGIASHMGFRLHLEPIDIRTIVINEFQTCCWESK